MTGLDNPTQIVHSRLWVHSSRVNVCSLYINFLFSRAPIPEYIAHNSGQGNSNYIIFYFQVDKVTNNKSHTNDRYKVHNCGQNITPTVLEGVYRHCIIPTIAYPSSLKSTEWVVHKVSVPYIIESSNPQLHSWLLVSMHTTKRRYKKATGRQCPNLSVTNSLKEIQ